MRRLETSSSTVVDSLPGQRPEESTAIVPSGSEPKVAISKNGHGTLGSPGIFFLVAPSSRMERIALFILIPAILAVLGALGYLFFRLEQRDGIAVQSLERFERRIQGLDAGIPFDSRRQRVLLGMRDRILVANPRIGLHDAYRYAELILEATEPFAAVPPLLLLSMGAVGSEFELDAIGPAGARGLYHIRPSTGRMLARSAGWEFREEMLFDPEVNTKLAALHLDILYAEHGDMKLALADYYGGARGAGLLLVSAEEVPRETRLYVREVFELYERLRTELASEGVALEPASAATDNR
ncbi:MAG: lytic transglycosylase domain-containing protein [Vicinamibacteria bacterium]